MNTTRVPPPDFTLDEWKLECSAPLSEAEKVEYQAKHSHQGDPTWRRSQELGRRRRFHGDDAPTEPHFCGIAVGETVVFTPTHPKGRIVRGIVQDLVNCDGEFPGFCRGLNIFCPEPDDPTRVLRVWAQDGHIVKHQEAHIVTAKRISYKSPDGKPLPFGHYRSIILGTLKLPGNSSAETIEMETRRAYPEANAFSVHHPKHGNWLAGTL